MAPVMARCLALFITSAVITSAVALVGQETLRFEVASVKPNVSPDRSITFRPNPLDGILLSNNPLDSLIRYAYGLQDFRVIGAPDWTRDARFDVAAKASHPITDAERRQMMRALLADRFRMKSHVEMREHTVYLMTPSRADKRLGAGLKPRPECESAAPPCQSGGSGRQDAIVLRAVTLKQLAEGMISAVRRELVLDETGIAGIFDVEMSFRPETSTDPADARPAFVTAMQEQLGMKLEPTRRQIEVLVIDSIDRPTPD
jgi:uncharacterized protein (TIGR03435 family)